MKEQEQEMFNEVALLKDMDHPNILKLFELY
jgi:calcium-dependent protein kinase